MHMNLFPDLHPDLVLAAFTIVLALVHIFWAASARTKELGVKWNAGPRDETPAPGLVSGRLLRAQANLYETLPLFLGAVALVHIAGQQDMLSIWGTHLYFFGRLIYLPLYRWGVTGLRTLAFLISLVGLGLVVYALFA